MLYLIGLSLSCFLFLLLLFKKGRTKADMILLVWVMVISVHLLAFYGLHTGFSYEYPHNLGLSIPMPLFHGILLYFYTLSLTVAEPIMWKKVGLHLVPSLLIVILAIPFYLLPPEEKVAVFQNDGSGFEWFGYILLPLIVISGFSYSIAAILVIRKHRSKLLHNFSNTDHKMLQWLEGLSVGLGIIWILAMFFDDSIVFGGVALFVLFIGFFGINQVPVFFNTSSVTDGTSPKQPEDTTKEKPTGSKPNLDSEKTHSILNDLARLMAEQKPYKDPDLTLGQLAAMLSASPNQLSFVINSHLGSSFYSYINDYRVDEFIKKAENPENRKFTMVYLAYECGFNSKTTFNKHFKLKTDKTPSEYFGHRKVSS